MLGPFTINIYMPSFEQMKAVFGVTDVELQITLSLYFAAFAFMSLWHGACTCSQPPSTGPMAGARANSMTTSAYRRCLLYTSRCV